MTLKRPTADMAFQAFAGTMADFFHKPVRYTFDSSRQNIIFTISGFPVYSRTLADVQIELPRNFIQVTGGSFEMAALNQRQVKLMQGGQTFKHAHVFDSGTPCWHSVGRNKLGTFFMYIVDTLLFSNISADSLRIGRKASSCIGETDSEILRNATSQRAYQKTILNPKVFQREDRFNIENFFNNTFNRHMNTLRQ